jgi:outer membrane protein
MRPFLQLIKEAGFSDLDLDGSLGLSVQLSADYQLDQNWSLNASARYINTDTSFKVGVNGSAEVEIDPMVYSLKLAYKF